MPRLPSPFLGETLATQYLDGITLSENVYAAGSSVAHHTHETSFFSLTLSGGYMERHGRREIQYGCGSVSFHPPGDEHSLRIGGRPTRCLNVEVGEQWLARTPARSAANDLVLLHDGPLLWLAARTFAVFRSGHATPMVLENLVLEMLGRVSEDEAPRERREPRWLVAVDEMIRAEFSTSLTVFELAGRVGVHPVHLSRTWRRFRGSSIARFLHRQRVDAACRLMSDGDLPLSELALEVGFADQAHFSNTFKAVTGHTPGSFRRLFG